MPKRVLQGVVVSDKNDKTVVVEVERRYTHPLLQEDGAPDKEVSRARREERLQDRRPAWQIEESRPISKNKRWVQLGRERRA